MLTRLQVLLWCGAALLTTSVHHGLGRHWDTLDEEERFNSRFYYMLGIWPAIMAIAVPKLAIVGLINRIFCPPTISRILLWSSVIIGLLNYLVVCLFSTFLCIPVRAFWDDSIKGAKCLSHGPYSSFAYYASSKYAPVLTFSTSAAMTDRALAYSALVDLYLAVYPAVIFRGLNFSVRKKIALSCALGLGVLYVHALIFSLSLSWANYSDVQFSVLP